LLREPESALHYNTKQWLASKLRASETLSVVTKCASSAGNVRCNTDLTSKAAEGWDEVRVETFIDPVRPDILLERAGAAILAIEIRATHAVSDAKAARLAELGIPWIEVVAGGGCDKWEPGTTLPAIRHESALALKFCPDHSQPTYTRYADSATARLGRASESPTRADLRGHGERWRFRVVDCYPYLGPRERKVFSVYCADLDAHAIRLRLVDDDVVVVASFVVAEVRASTGTTESLRKVHACLRQHVEETFSRFDSPQMWLDSREYPENPAEVYSDDFMPVKYRRDANGAWEAI